MNLLKLQIPYISYSHDSEKECRGSETSKKKKKKVTLATCDVGGQFGVTDCAKLL